MEDEKDQPPPKHDKGYQPRHAFPKTPRESLRELLMWKYRVVVTQFRRDVLRIKRPGEIWHWLHTDDLWCGDCDAKHECLGAPQDPDNGGYKSFVAAEGWRPDTEDLEALKETDSEDHLCTGELIFLSDQETRLELRRLGRTTCDKCGISIYDRRVRL